MNEQLQSQLAEILKAMKGAVEQYGPEAMQLALEVRRWDAVNRLTTGIVLLLIAYFGFRFVLKLYRREIKAFSEAKAADIERNRYSSLEPIQPYLILIGGGVVAAGLSYEGLTRMLYIWHWVALFRPEFAFAHDLLLKVGLAR